MMVVYSSVMSGQGEVTSSAVWSGPVMAWCHEVLCCAVWSGKGKIMFGSVRSRYVKVM